jgi:preprotein translocase subunit SecG
MGILSFLFFINSVLIGEYWHRKKARSENMAIA